MKSARRSGRSTALVTGGAGFVGSHLVDQLIVRGYRVVVVDDLSSGKVEHVNPAADLEELDIRDSRLAELVASVGPDVVFHAAAQVSVAVSAREPVLDAAVNVIGSLNLFDSIRKAATKTRLVFVSTGGAMYGDADVLPAPETLPARPGSPYGASKLAIENYLPVFKTLYGIEYSIVRPANIYGPRQDPHGEAGVVAIFTRAMLGGAPVRIFGDGTDQRDYIYVEDLVRLFIKVAESQETGPFNAGTGLGTSVNDLFGKLASLTEYNLEPLHEGRRPGDLRRITLDSRIAADRLGWKPGTDLDEGLGRTVEWFRAQLESTKAGDVVLSHRSAVERNSTGPLAD